MRCGEQHMAMITNPATAIEIERNHGDLWVFDGAINRGQKAWVGGELVAIFHKPLAVRGQGPRGLRLHPRFASTSGPQASMTQ